MQFLLTAAIVLAVLAIGVTAGRHAAVRAERHTGAWAWMAYVFLGGGMVFGAMSMDHTLLAAFMWAKLTVFVGTGLWLVQGRWRRGESVLPRRLAQQNR